MVYFGFFFISPLLFCFLTKSLVNQMFLSLALTRPGFGQCCFAANAMLRVTQFHLRAFFKAEHLWG